MTTRAAYAIPLDIIGFLGKGPMGSRRIDPGQHPVSDHPDKGTFLLVSEEESIRHHLGLLLTTARDEFPPDPEFGCELWEHEFTSVLSSNAWMDRLEKGLVQLVERYEKRLTLVEVKARLDQVEFKLRKDEHVAARLKRRLHILFKARLARTDEPFEFERNLLIAPYSLD